MRKTSRVTYRCRLVLNEDLSYMYTEYSTSTDTEYALDMKLYYTCLRLVKLLSARRIINRNEELVGKQLYRKVEVSFLDKAGNTIAHLVVTRVENCDKIQFDIVLLVILPTLLLNLVPVIVDKLLECNET